MGSTVVTEAGRRAVRRSVLRWLGEGRMHARGEVRRIPEVEEGGYGRAGAIASREPLPSSTRDYAEAAGARGNKQAVCQHSHCKGSCVRR